MKLVSTAIFALLLVASVSGKDNNLQREIQIPMAEGKSSSDGQSLLESIFGNLNAGSKPSTLSDSPLNQRAIFKGLQSLNKLREGAESNKEQNDFGLPYQALLPRRRMPLDLKTQNAEKLFSFASQKQKVNPLQELMSGLNQQNKGQDQRSAKWQNPMFSNRDNGDLLPFFNIFGKKNNKKNKFSESISERQIQTKLIQQVPFLQGGRLVKMTSNRYKKGVFLHIQFQDKNNKMYNVIARYRPKKHNLQIVSIKENTFERNNEMYTAGLEGKSFNVKPSENQQWVQQKDNQLKALNERLAKMEAQNKVLSQKVASKQVTEAKAASKNEDKKQTQSVIDKKEVSEKETPKVVQEKQNLVEQKKPQKQDLKDPKSTEKQAINTEQSVNKNILNQ